MGKLLDLSVHLAGAWVNAVLLGVESAFDLFGAFDD